MTGRRSHLSFLLPGVVVVVIATVAFLWWVSGRSVRGQSFRSAALVPEHALLYVSLDLDPTSANWMALSRHVQRLGLEPRLQDLRDEALLEEFGLEWKRDIIPFLGGEAAAFITMAGGSDANSAVLVRVQNREAAVQAMRQALARRAVQRRASIQTEKYDGVEIRFLRVSGREVAAAALVDDYIVLAERRGSLMNVIDVNKGRISSLAARSGFQEMRRRAGGESLLFTYVDGENLWSSIRAGGTGMDAAALARSLGLKNASDIAKGAAAFLIQAEKTGLRMEGLAWFPQGSQTESTPALYQPRLAEVVPGDSLLFVSGYDLYNTALRPVVEIGAGLPVTTSPHFGPASPRQVVQDALAQFKRQYDIDLEQDFLALLRKEFALSIVLPSLQQPDTLSLLFAAEVSDPNRMEVTLRKLRKGFESEGVRVRTAQIGSADFVTVERPGAKQSAGYALRGNQLFVGYQAQAVQVALQRIGSSLAEDSDYIVTTSLLADGRGLTNQAPTSLIYFSLRRLIMLLQGHPEIRQALAAEEWRNLEALRGIAVVNGIRDGAPFFSVVVSISEGR